MYCSKMFETIKKEILSHDIISFDIFDTLLVRPYLQPKDLFLHIEKSLGLEHFQESRILAEEMARKKIKRADVTIDEIYDEISDNFKSVKKQELQWEDMVLQPNPLMFDLYKTAKDSGKKIVIASDMYLPTDFIVKVLKKNGFDKYHKLYVSNDSGISKYNGSMFDKIIKDMKVKPECILHIGDNKHSDYKVPLKKGIKAILVPSLTKEYIKDNYRIKQFIESRKNDLGASILVSVLAYYNTKNNDNNYWHKLGYEYGGPVMYSYLRWIFNESKKIGIDNLFFVARDGYTLQKVFDTFNTKIKHSYIYAPRFINLVCRLQYRTGNSSVALAQQRTIIEHYKNNKRLSKKYNDYDFKKNSLESFIEQNIKTLQELAASKFSIYKNYLARYIDKKTHKIGIIDTITENFSAQNLISAGLEDKNVEKIGFYWYVRTLSQNKYSAFVNTSLKQCAEYVKNWGIMEFLMSSPEFPIEGISEDFKPIYKTDISSEEKYIRQVYPDISGGSVDFALDIKKFFGGNDIYIDYDTIVEWVNCFCSIPYKSDFINMGKIQTSSNPNNDIYESLFRAKLKLSYMLKHPIKYYKKIKSFMWTTPFEKTIVCMTHPIELHTRGIKQISVYILPRLNKSFINMKIKLFKKFLYEIIIGSKDEI